MVEFEASGGQASPMAPGTAASWATLPLLPWPWPMPAACIDEQEQLVARAGSTCMTLRGEQAQGR